MRRALPFLLVLAMLAPAHAQVGAPAVGSLALPLVLSATLERSSAMGCSQSFQSSSGTAQVQLTVDANGAARFTLEGDYGTTTGPSRGRYRAGDHEVSHIREVHRSLWSGTATPHAGSLLVTFDHVAAAEMRTSGFGTLPLPAPTVQPFTGQLLCHLEQVGVLPAVAAAGEVSTQIDLVRCAWAGTPPAPFDRYADSDPFALGSAGGVQNRLDDPMWSVGPTHEVRLLP